MNYQINYKVQIVEVRNNLLYYYNKIYRGIFLACRQYFSQNLYVFLLAN